MATINGGSGNDTITATTVGEVVNGNAGNDTLLTAVSDVTLNGGSGQDSLVATGQRDLLDGGDGDDHLTGGLHLFGGGGDDTLTSVDHETGFDHPQLDGGDGNDSLSGTSSPEALTGGNGNDTIAGYSGFDTETGGAGDDLFIWDATTGGAVLAHGGEGADTLLMVETPADNFLTVTGNSQGMTVLGQDEFGRTITNTQSDGIETFDFKLVGGSNTLLIGDLRLTEANTVNVEISRPVDDPDGSPNRISIVETAAPGPVGVHFGDDQTAETLIFARGDNLPLIFNFTGLGQRDFVAVSNLNLLTGRDGIGDFLLEPGGAGAVRALGGNDTIIWQPDSGSDTIDGGAGDDTQVIQGGAGFDHWSVGATGSHVMETLEGAGPDPTRFHQQDLLRVETLDLSPGVGSSVIELRDLAGTDVKAINIDWTGSTGSGNPRTLALTGTLQADHLTAARNSGGDLVINGWAQSVTVHGGGDPLDLVRVALDGGDDQVDLSAIDASIRFAVDAGSGADTVVAGTAGYYEMVDGGAGLDTQVLTGSSGADALSVGASGANAMIANATGLLVQDVNVETLTFRPLGGADYVLVGDLNGTAVTTVNVDLSAASGAPDNLADTVVLEGPPPGEQVSAQLGADGASETVAYALNGVTLRTVNVTGMDAQDTVSVQGLSLLSGSNGADVLHVSAGAETLNGLAGDDTFVWQPGAGSATIDGGAGADIQAVATGSGADLIIVGAGAAGHVTESLDGLAQDLVGVEALSVKTGDGSDTIKLADLSATDVKAVNIDLSGPSGGPDDASDTVQVAGTLQADILTATRAVNGDLVLSGGPETLTLHAANGLDLLQIATSAGGDRINLSALPAGGVGLAVFAGAGDDTVIGTQGASPGDYLAIHGDTGDDNIRAGAFNLVFGETGDDILTSLGGHNTFVFNSYETGQDQLFGFHTHAGGLGDTIELSGYVDHSFADLLAHGHLVQQANGDTAVTDGLHTIVTLHDVQLGSLGAADFIFA